METFKDYKDNPRGLIGKKVLYISRYSKKLSVIKGVKKLHFNLETIEGNFRLSDGAEVVPQGRQNWGTGGTCQIITNEEYENYKRQFKEYNQSAKWREQITQALPKLGYETLEKISKLI
jgi:hypothetical protein